MVERRDPAIHRYVAVSLLVLSGIAGVSCEPTSESEASLTSSTVENACIVDDVVVDPDNRVVALEPGCTIDLEGQAFGQGGSFDVSVTDNAGGGGGDYFPIYVANGDRFSVAYTPGDSLPSEVEVQMYLDPHSAPYVCSYDSHGAGGSKTFQAATAAPDCIATFRVVDEVDLGELRFTVSYAAAAADPTGCGEGVACESPMHQHGSGPFGGSVPSDSDDEHLLYLPVRSGQGFSAPVDVYRCGLRKHSATEDPSPEDFVVTVTSALSPPPLSKPFVELPSIEARIDCDLGATTTTTLPYAPADCGRPCSTDSPTPKARDALYVVNAAVGLATCKTCICDVNRSGIVDATDGLAVLSRAVGLDALIRCVLCAEPVAPACGQ